MIENAKIKNLMEGSLKVKIAKIIPPRILNCLLLFFPFLYETRFINFESYSYPVIDYILYYRQSARIFSTTRIQRLQYLEW